MKAYVRPVSPTCAGHDERRAVEQWHQRGEGAGRAYLMQRRAATQRREQTAQEDARIAEELHAELAGLATMSQRLAPQDPKLSGYTGVMVLNGTYLLDDAQVERFNGRRPISGSSHVHIRLEVGGPWPPYSFSSLDAS